MTQLRTTVKNQEEKIDIIEHVNQDHTNELCEIVYAHSKHKKIVSVRLTDLFEEGGILHVEVEKGVFEEVYVPFTIKGELEEKVLYLAYKAMIDNGKFLASGKKQYFEIVENTFVTKNMLRLTIKSDTEIPTAPASAYLFSLKKLEKIRKTTEKAKSTGSFTKFYGKLFLFIMKLLSSKQRSSLLKSMNKKNRYYTIRKTWEENNTYFAHIDVYIHGKTDGADWAKSLQQGDIISSVNEYKEKVAHLSDGKALLIADETALPAVASIVEQWKNPLKPHIILVVNNRKEQGYLNKIKDNLFETEVILNSEELYENIIKAIEDIGNIETVWGALEKDTATKLRNYFRNTVNIQGKNNRVLGYWKRG